MVQTLLALIETYVKQIQDLNQSRIQTLMSNYGIAWKFNTPVSPWMDGSWESLIKLSKRALKTVTNDKTYHEESLIAILCEIQDTSPHEYRSKWKSVQRAVNLFWERFIREYVPSLQRRQKWLTNH